jgi:hypothetical protein
MTAPETPAPASPTRKGRSPGVVAAIVIVVVIALVGGAFVVYKLTKSKEEVTPMLQVAKRTVAAIKSGDSAELRTLSTGQGTTQLLALKPADVDGITIIAPSCKIFAASTPTRVCTASRPGGQLTLRLVVTDGAWKVDSANVGPAGLPPESTTTTTIT